MLWSKESRRKDLPSIEEAGIDGRMFRERKGWKLRRTTAMPK